MSERINLTTSTCDQVDSIIEHIKAKDPKSLWMFDIQKAYWDMVRDAHKNGKKVIFYGGPVPLELIYALDAVPFYLDMVPTRLANTVEKVSVYIDEAEKHVPPMVCGLDKVELGVALRGEYGVQPDAFVYGSVPCDSSRTCYPAVDKVLGVPSFRFDTPFRRDERGYQYQAEQIEKFIPWLEEITGNKLDWERFTQVAKCADESYVLLDKCSSLRKLKPCPLPGRMLVLNEIFNCMAGHPALVTYMQAQYDMGKELADKGLGACREEKYRVCWLQNIVWANAGLLDWMERTYGAILVMDGFGFQDGILYNGDYSKENALHVMAEKMMYSPMIHGASGPAEHYIKMVEQIMADYSVDVSMFIGHVGCKHTFAAAKMVTDMIQDKFGLPTLNLEVDAIDLRYKGVDEVKAEIAAYMETVVGAKPMPKPEKKPKA